MKEIVRISKDKDNNIILDNLNLTPIDAFNVIYLLADKVAGITGLSYNEVLDSLMMVECDDGKSVEIENNNKNILEDIKNG